MKATPDEYAFHQRMLASDEQEVFEELASSLYHRLVYDVFQRIGNSSPSFNPHMVEEAVGQALLDYNDEPERYDPERSTLRSYLGMMAHSHFRDARKKEQRYADHQVSFSLLSALEMEQQLASSTEEVENAFVVKESLEQLNAAFTDPIERRIVSLIVNRVRSRDPYVRVLNLQHLSEPEQRKEVKRVRERLVKRMRRLSLLPEGDTQRHRLSPKGVSDSVKEHKHEVERRERSLDSGRNDL